MGLDVLIICLLIFAARIGDVSLGTIRTVMIVQGRRIFAWVLGFFEVLIWLLAAAQVFEKLHEQPIYAIFYALGFATGNYVGLTVERWLSIGSQAVRIFTRKGPCIAERLRAAGFGVTQFDGHGLAGPVHELFVHARRRSVPRAVQQARETDPDCFYVVEDVRVASTAGMMRQPTGWRAVLKMK